MKMYQKFARVSFRISGIDDVVVHSRSILPLVTEFRQRLKNFHFEEGSFCAWVEGEPDDFNVNYSGNVADCSLRINIEMRDAKHDGSDHRYNQFNISVLANRLKDLSFSTGDMALDFVKC
jgi:hypothetical protein